MPVPGPTIDATGITIPDLQTIQDAIKADYRAIYGSDTYLENDAPDGQFIALLANRIDVQNKALVQAYNSRDPANAMGEALSEIVKINGIRRNVPTRSVVNVLIVGQFGITINNGIVSDINNNRWSLPAVVTIPIEGQITVAATAITDGAILASPNTVNIITTPTFGWQSVNNVSAATPGSAVETDAQLRQRQAASTALPAHSTLDAIIAGIGDITAVTRVRAYENDTSAPNTSGIPGHSISLVVEGGDATAIATLIQHKKPPGTGTYGDVVTIITDAYGFPHSIAFFRPIPVPITCEVSLRSKTGYSSQTETDIKNAMVAWLNALDIGESVNLKRSYTPANLYGVAEGELYDLVTVKFKRGANALAEADIPIAFNEEATSIIANVSIVVVP